MSPPLPPGFRGVFRTDEAARAVYSEAAGIARIIPRAVAVPADEADVASLVPMGARRMRCRSFREDRAAAWPAAPSATA